VSQRRPLSLSTHDEALRLGERYGLSMFDALIVAAARQGEYSLLYSEDLQDGMVIDGTLRIVNPFRESVVR
jgi:predicted nucleic acid-binding protein